MLDLAIHYRSIFENIKTDSGIYQIYYRSIIEMHGV